MNRFKMTLMGLLLVLLAACAAPQGGGQKPASSGSTVVDTVQDTGRSMYDSVKAFFSRIFN
jgi:hypothetical protein